MAHQCRLHLARDCIAYLEFTIEYGEKIRNKNFHLQIYMVASFVFQSLLQMVYWNWERGWSGEIFWKPVFSFFFFFITNGPQFSWMLSLLIVWIFFDVSVPYSLLWLIKVLLRLLWCYYFICWIPWRNQIQQYISMCTQTHFPSLRG